MGLEGWGAEACAMSGHQGLGHSGHHGLSRWRQHNYAQNVKADWRDIARDFWTKSAEDSVKSKPSKLNRTKMYEWMCATTHMLRIAMGKNGHLGLPNGKWAT